MSNENKNGDPDVPVAKDETKEGENRMIYGLQDQPPWSMTIFLAIQHFSINFTGSIIGPFILAKALCFEGDSETLTRLIATSLLVSGMSTVLQIIFGCRLPIVQGPSAAYIVPVLTMLSVRGDCPHVITANSTETEIQISRVEAYSRMSEVQGALIVAALVQMFVGFSGLIGVILRFIGPLTIGVTLTMIAIGIFPIMINIAGTNWAISLPAMMLVILFSTILNKKSIPLPGGRSFRIFSYFPILLAVSIMWVLCAVLTFVGVFPEDSDEYGYAARVDTEIENLVQSPWISLPYPGQWGWPSFNVAGIIGMMSAVLASVIESVGDYYACAQVACAPSPPTHAVNRGIGVEGVGCLFAGLWGSGLGYTSYSGDVSLLSLTKVASRTVSVGSGFVFILAGFFNKFSAFLSGIPDPVLATTAVTIGMVASIGISNFCHAKMSTPRNLIVVGISLCLAIGLPIYFDANPVDTGMESIDQLIEVLLKNGMFVGGITCAVLDIVVPATHEERGLNWKTLTSNAGSEEGKKHNDPQNSYSVYNLPFAMTWLSKNRFMRYLPFSPTFQASDHVVPVEAAISERNLDPSVPRETLDYLADSQGRKPNITPEGVLLPERSYVPMGQL